MSIIQATWKWLWYCECKYTYKWSWDWWSFWGRKGNWWWSWSRKRLLETIHAAFNMVIWFNRLILLRVYVSSISSILSLCCIFWIWQKTYNCCPSTVQSIMEMSYHWLRVSILASNYCGGMYCLFIGNNLPSDWWFQINSAFKFRPSVSKHVNGDSKTIVSFLLQF